MIDYSQYWFKLRTIKYKDDGSIVEVSYEFNLIYKQIKSFETIKIGETNYTLIKFDDRTTLIVNRDIKRFRAEILPKYNEVLNDYLSKHPIE